MARTVFNARTLGAFIKDARSKQGLTQQQLAEQAGVSRSWLIGVEQGKRSGAEMSKIFALLSALNTPMIFDEPARTPLPQEDPEEERLTATSPSTSSGAVSATSSAAPSARPDPEPASSVTSWLSHPPFKEQLNTYFRDHSPISAYLSHVAEEAIKPLKIPALYTDTFDLGVKNILQAQTAAWAAPSGITAALNQQKTLKPQGQSLPAKEDDDNPQGRA